MAEWLEALTPDLRARAECLIRVLRRLGDTDAEARVQADIAGDAPEVASFLLLHRLWSGTIDGYRKELSWIQRAMNEAEKTPSTPFADAGAALQRMLNIGVPADDIGTLARFIAYTAVFDLLYVLDFGCHTELFYQLRDKDRDCLPGWVLMEKDLLEEVLSGREIGSLHESVLGAGPTGQEGRPA